MTKAYIIAQAAVTNPEQYEGYKALAGAAVAKYGGKYIVRGGARTCSKATGPRRA